MCYICLDAQLAEQNDLIFLADSSNLSLNKNIYIMQNHFWNMFTNINNGQLAKRAFIFQKKKKLCEAFLKILWNENFIVGYKISKKNRNLIKIFLKYVDNGKPAINNIKLVTRPGKRVFYSIKQIWKIDSSKNFFIFSTNKGLLSIESCKKLKIGGELFIVVN